MQALSAGRRAIAIVLEERASLTPLPNGLSADHREHATNGFPLTVIFRTILTVETRTKERRSLGTLDGLRWERFNGPAR